MTRRVIKTWADLNQRAALHLEPVALRVPDRGAGAFGEGRRERLTVPGRPSCLYSDTIVSVNRVRAMEA